jgi:hypothetical protein
MRFVGLFCFAAFCWQKHCHIKDTVIPEDRQKIYCININQDWKGLNKAISSWNITKKAMFWSMKDSRRLYSSESRFLLKIVPTARSSVRTQSQKVRVRFLSERPSEREPHRAPIHNLSRRPSGREPPKAPICKDVRTQKWRLRTKKIFPATVWTLGQAVQTPFSKT